MDKVYLVFVEFEKGFYDERKDEHWHLHTFLNESDAEKCVEKYEKDPVIKGFTNDDASPIEGRYGFVELDVLPNLDGLKYITED